MKKTRSVPMLTQEKIQRVAAYYDGQSEEDSVAEITAAFKPAPSEQIVNVAIVCKDQLLCDGLKAICINIGFSNILEAESVLEVVLTVPNNHGPQVVVAFEEMLDEKELVQLQKLKSSRRSAVILISGQGQPRSRLAVADKNVNQSKGALPLIAALRALLGPGSLGSHSTTIGTTRVSEKSRKYGGSSGLPKDDRSKNAG